MKLIRKINMFVSGLLVLLILLHGILGSFQLLGIGTHAGTIFAWTGLVLMIIHMGIGCILTVRTIRTKCRSGGNLYLRENAAFWIRRLTGLAIVFLVYFHMGMFVAENNGSYVLLPFTGLKLAAMLALIASVFLHLFLNIRPFLISMGILTDQERRMDILVFLSAILVFISISVVLYYISWCI